MEFLYSYLILFLVAMIPFMEMPVAAPLAVFIGLPIVPVIIIAFAGNFLSLLITIWFIYGIKGVAERRRARKEGDQGFISKRRTRAKRIWGKYSMPGLAIIGMFFVGGHITALAACSFTGNRFSVTLWMAISMEEPSVSLPTSAMIL
ncbi:small multi-drug export protein [Salicibibacter kimchii]|uniref:DNA-binding protein n=1 Tax=Salicibibacter kimchii TaxID=2099786 RepID=A0A345C1Q3_9BACI|nr:small multi-drug export protein [Salicibibacter kimchii]AXF57134.1 DNA-binding protein [Salicibibacter kimchii]